MGDTKPLILLADDDPDIRAILRTKLEATGFRVHEAENGQAAIDQCKQERPDLIIMDVRMPVMSGTEAVMRMKEDATLRDIKIVFLSNFGEEAETNTWIDQKYAREIGAVEYLKKSENLDTLVLKIQKLLHD